MLALMPSLFWIANGYAVMDIEINEGRAKRLEIIVEEFQGQYDYPDRYKQYLAEIIRSDLKNSGEFYLVASNDREHITEDMLRLKGKIISKGEDKIEVTYRLSTQKLDQKIATLRLKAKKRSNKSKIKIPKPLIRAALRADPGELRALAHQISGHVYQHLTGQPAVFNTKIAYILVKGKGKQQRFSIQISDYDGFDIQTLLTSRFPVMSLSWSPDGKQLAYVSFEGNRSAIYVQELSTGKRKIVSKLPGINGAPAWSPDGKKLALVLTSSGYPKIHQLDLATRQLTQLTFGQDGLDTEPAWSHDGKKLVFTSDRSGSPQIHCLDLNTNMVKLVTREGGYNVRASFKPDQRDQIVFLHREAGMFTVATQRLDDAKPQIIALIGENGETPALSPNGQMVILVRNQHGTGHLAIVAIDGRQRMVLPGIHGEIRDTAWSGW